MNHKSWFTIAALLLGYILVASTFMGVAPIGEAEAQKNLSREERNWESHNHNPLGTNYNPQTIINPDNVANLGMKWMYPIPSLKFLHHPFQEWTSGIVKQFPLT